MSKKANYKDFDKFIEEKEGVDISFKMYGKEYKLPSKLPVIVVLKANKAERTGDEGVVFEMMYDLLGEDQFEDLLQEGITMDVLANLMEWAMEQYVGISEGETGKKVGKRRTF